MFGRNEKILDTNQCRFKNEESKNCCFKRYKIDESDVGFEEVNKDGSITITFGILKARDAIRTGTNMYKLMNPILPEGLDFGDCWWDKMRKEIYFYDTISEPTATKLALRLQKEEIEKRDVMHILSENESVVAIVYRRLDVSEEMAEDERLLKEEMSELGMEIG